MSKLLKVIVNTLLLLAILSAGALVIPPFAGITTLVSDGMGNTNISRGAVTYAKKTDTSSVATGDKILVDDNSGKYIYTIQSLDTAAGTASGAQPPSWAASSSLTTTCMARTTGWMPTSLDPRRRWSTPRW